MELIPPHEWSFHSTINQPSRAPFSPQVPPNVEAHKRLAPAPPQVSPMRWSLNSADYAEEWTHSERIDNINIKGRRQNERPGRRRRTTGDRRGPKEDNQGLSGADHMEPRPVVRNTTARQPTTGRKAAEDGKQPRTESSRGRKSSRGPGDCRLGEIATVDYKSSMFMLGNKLG